jgi:hypothetical protein
MKYYTLVDRDVGKNHIKAFNRVWLVSDFMGRVLETDVGKRVYLACGDGYAPFLQVENDEQREARLKRYGAMMRSEPVCECVDTLCRTTVADTGHHPAGGRPVAGVWGCGQPAVMHLFRVSERDRPVDFCDPCGDNALQSGAWATGEDVAAARREANNDASRERPTSCTPIFCSHEFCGGGSDLGADLEKDLGDGGLGSGRWLEGSQ